MKGILIVFYFYFPPSLSPCLSSYFSPSLPPPPPSLSLSLPTPSFAPFLSLPSYFPPSLSSSLPLSLSYSLSFYFSPFLLPSLPPSLREATRLPASSLQRYSLRQKGKVQYEEDVISDDDKYICKYYYIITSHTHTQQGVKQSCCLHVCLSLGQN